MLSSHGGVSEPPKPGCSNDDIEILGEPGEEWRPSRRPPAPVEIEQRRALPVTHDARLDPAMVSKLSRPGIPIPYLRARLFGVAQSITAPTGKPKRLSRRQTSGRVA